MDKVKDDSGKSRVINISEKINLQHGLTPKNYGEVTKDTIAILTLANAQPAEENSLIKLSLSNEPTLIRARPTDLLAKLNEQTLHTHWEKAQIIQVHFPKCYRAPVICGQGIFVPFDGPTKGQTDWYNILLLSKLEKESGLSEEVEDTRLIFQDNQQIILPRRQAAVVAKVTDCLHRAHFYFKLYNHFLGGDQQHPSPTVPLIEAKMKELSIRNYYYPGEDVFYKGLWEFKKNLATNRKYQEVSEWESDY